MKKHLAFLHNDAGFYFVYTIWVTMLLLAVTLTMITGYRMHVEETQRLIDVTRKENIIEMTKAMIEQEEILLQGDEQENSYQFPHANVKVISKKIDESTMRVQINIETKDHTYEERVYVKNNP